MSYDSVRDLRHNLMFVITKEDEKMFTGFIETRFNLTEVPTAGHLIIRSKVVVESGILNDMVMTPEVINSPNITLPHTHLKVGENILQFSFEGEYT